MLEPPFPLNETHRLRSLRELNILDTPAEERFDRITRLASNIFEVPIAAITLVDDERNWLKSRIGLDIDEAPRSTSFSAHAILEENDLLVIEDAKQDERFHDNPAVMGDPKIRFYAGCQLVATNGSKLGALCIVDRKPRVMNSYQQAVLRDLAAIISNELNVIALAKTLRYQQESEKKVRALLDNLPEGVVTVGRNGLIESFNPAAESIFQTSADEMIGLNIQRWLADAQPKIHKWTRQNSRSRPQQLVGKRKDGSSFPLEFSVSTMYLKGQKKYAVLVRDISERMKVEEQKRLFTIKQSNYIAAAAHELRTPLASLQGFSELLLKRNFDGETARVVAQTIHQKTGQLGKLINNMLNLAQIEAGQGADFDIRIQPLGPIIERTLTTISGIEKIQRITVQIPHNLPRVAVDAQKIQQAFLNILSNSIKYSPGEGLISITASVSDDHPERPVAIHFQDGGIGMSPDQVAQIFDRFYRAHQLKSAQGSGLGMSIFKEIIDLHDASVEIKSELDKGTEITVRLPCKKRT